MIGGGAEWGEDTFTSDSPPASITLTMRQGPNPGQRFTVRKENVAVGRLPGNDISIPDSQVSRHHANITWENGQWLIRDLGSANGTAVNGTAIADACPLRDGDVIALGEIVLTFQGSAILATPGE
jgi:pSer/pThr/pTyr-binding forkhead associated (FHA) protein